MKRKKLLLVFPKSLSVGFDDVENIRSLTGRSGLMNASLATIAALTASDFDVKIIDENLEAIDFDEPFDLVGITGFYLHIGPAARIARKFRKRNVKVVCGGPSVSVSPDRWRPFADVLIIGEAERVWPEFIADYMAGCAKSEYRETERLDLSISRVPDYSGYSEFSKRRYLGGIVQTSRGCPFDCEFCQVIVYMGRKMRFKPVEVIIGEVEQMRKMGMKVVFLADDNFYAGRGHSKEILRALREWNLRQRKPLAFVTQASIDMADDEEFLQLATEAGLNRVMVGIESPNTESLREVHKVQNLRSNVIGDLKRFSEYGILVLATTMIGFDHDDLSVFQQQFDFFMRTGVVIAQPFPLHAMDGTPLKERMVKEGRYLNWNPFEERERIYNFNIYTMRPKQMTVTQLRQGILWLVKNLYEPENVVPRLREFFEAFEKSPQKKRLRISSRGIDRESLGVLGRLLRYALTQAPSEERSSLREMMRLAARSSHPQRFEIAITSFLGAKSMKDILLQIDPDPDASQYPVPLETGPAS